MTINIGEITSSIFNIVQPLDEEATEKVLLSIAILKGVTLHSKGASNTPPSLTFEQPIGASQYFKQKNPKSKIEELAVAARLLEINSDGQNQHGLDSFISIFRQASRNFDSTNFINDMKNAKRAGLFIKGGPKGLHQLSYSGQNLVDAMPNENK